MENYTLTTNHAASSYGVPVLVDSDGNAYGPGDTLPTGETAASLVTRIVSGRARVIQFPVENGRVPAIAEGLISDWDDPVDLLGAIEHTNAQAALFLR